MRLRKASSTAGFHVNVSRNLTGLPWGSISGSKPMSTRLSTVTLSFTLTLLAGGCDAEPENGHRLVQERLVQAGAAPGAHLDDTLDLMIEVGYDDLASLEEPMTPEDQEALAADIQEAFTVAPDDQPIHRAAIGATVTSSSGGVGFECGDPITLFVATVGARIMSQNYASQKCGALRAHVLSGGFSFDFNSPCNVEYGGEYRCR